jgi:hypothetical protein
VRELELARFGNQPQQGVVAVYFYVLILFISASYIGFSDARAG